MSKLVLIHGFAIGLTTPFFRPAFGPSASFSAFDKMVESREAAVFPWGIEQQVNLFQLLNLFFVRNHYEDEKFLAQARETLERLQVFLEQEQPEIIVCHSMGCFLLNNYLKNFALPKSVSAIVFSQSDDIMSSYPTKALSLRSYSDSLSRVEGSDASESKSSISSIHHLYCPWDPTLIISSIYNKKWRAGLWSIGQKNVKNIFFPLYLPFNLHTSSIRDKKLVEFIEEL